jgi:hypothetical protein
MIKFGFRMKPKRPIVARDVQMMCDMLGTMFGEGHKFGPEAITEGGIEWLKWPGKEEGKGYKTMRIGFASHGTWPHISGNRFQDEDVVLWDPERAPCAQICTVMKSFEGAPAWTREEMKRCAAAAADCLGVRIVKNGAY